MPTASHGTVQIELCTAKYIMRYTDLLEAVVLKSGTRMPPFADANRRWLAGIIRPAKVRRAVAAVGHAIGDMPGTLTPADIDEYATLLSQYVYQERERYLATARAERERIDAQHQAFLRTPEGQAAQREHEARLAAEIRKQAEERAAYRAAAMAYLQLPIAAVWRKDRRAHITSFAEVGMVVATREAAIAATLEAIPRLAARWGFKRRHTSNSSGRADSRYLIHDDEMGRSEVRISNHAIPVYGERQLRYDTQGGPRWDEIIIGDQQLSWTIEQWRQELLLAAGVDPAK